MILRKNSQLTLELLPEIIIIKIWDNAGQGEIERGRVRIGIYCSYLSLMSVQNVRKFIRQWSFLLSLGGRL